MSHNNKRIMPYRHKLLLPYQFSQMIEI
jgi:hypothetical protein